MSLILFNRTLEQQVKSILLRSGGSLYLPLPSTCFTDSAGTTPCAVDDPVGKLLDLTGTNHATQATAGFKPILRGKVKNWLVNTATLSTQAVAVAVSGLTWTLSFTGTGTVTLSGGYAGSLVGTGVSDRVSLTFTTTAATNVTYTVSGSVTEAQAEIGGVMNAYVASSATPKSSSYGPYWLDFDGADDRLDLTTVPIPQANPFHIGISAQPLAGTGLFYSESSPVELVALLSVGMDSSTLAAGIRRDNANTISKSTVATNLGSFKVFSGYFNGAVNNIRVNSVEGTSANVAQATTTLTTAVIGARGRGTYDTFHKGPIGGFSIVPRALSSADMLKIEKYLAKKAEISL
jgi:hypothetical protein